MSNDRVTLTALCLLVISTTLASAFVTSPNLWSSSLISSSRTSLGSSSSTTDEFAAFAASLEEEEEEQPNKTTFSTATETETRTNGSSSNNKKSWQEDLDKLLDPTTPFTKRQILLQDLLSANEEIRSSVETAMRDRKIDPLLTPRSKRLQEGSRAVARQLTTDILPSLVPQPPSRRSTGGASASTPSVDLPKVSNRILNAITNQVQSNLQTLQQDLANPRRIPARLSKQRSTFWKEAANVFAETPAGLKEPPYQTVRTTEDYEIRDYEAYTVASTTMTAVDDDMGRETDPALQGAAFNSLAAYVFGANRQQVVMNMTTPVTTTMSGEMRFYLDTTTTEDDIPPEPLEQDEANSVYETDRIFIQEIPPCRLAVRRFPGFATRGEIKRQKKSLLTALELDQVELDVPHGAAVPHVVFQYNPPYTLPVVRRNEIAVAVLDETSKVEASLQQATPEDAWKDADASSSTSSSSSLEN